MSHWLKDFFSPALRSEQTSGEVLGEGLLPPSEDTLAAINELSRVVKNNPDAVEIYLALGNLYRSQGEIERAVHIRQNLIVRPGLRDEFKARALYELGRDYKRGGFVDRAFEAFQQARSLAGNNPSITQELAKLCAEAEDYLQAARYYVELGNSLAEAHYLVRQSQKEARDHPDGKGQALKWLERALKVAPDSMEAWLEKMHRALLGLEKQPLSRLLEQGLRLVPEAKRFMLLDGLVTSIKSEELPFFDSAEEVNAILIILSDYPQDLLLQYYGGLLLLHLEQFSEAQLWFEKCLLLDTNFWLARLELLALALKNNTLPQSVEVQLIFFLSRAREVKRFICRQCGLKRESVFFVCPRCGSWHSISFRRNLNE
ncbi:MAG TPA: tetratricopeptide repeat protein [Desulfonatronum sp.]|nr:tetratricopeptide repeat protein [Desulfonatronum sp.]